MNSCINYFFHFKIILNKIHDHHFKNRSFTIIFSSLDMHVGRNFPLRQNNIECHLYEGFGCLLYVHCQISLMILVASGAAF